MKFNSMLNTVVTANLKANKVPFLVGEPGIGKTSWVEELGNILGTKVFTLQCNELSEKADLTGVRTVPIDNDNYKQVFFPHADIMDAILYAQEHPDETPILFMDEINRTTSDVTSALLSIPTRRRVGNVDLPSNLRIVLAGNDKGNVTMLDTASVSRYVFYKVVPDAQVFLNLGLEIYPAIEQSLLQNPKHIFERVEIEESDLFDDDSMDQFTTPRTLHGLSETLKALDRSVLMNLLANPAIITAGGSEHEVDGLMEMISGHIGYTSAAKDIHTRITEELDSPEELNIEMPEGYEDTVYKSTTVDEIFAKLDALEPKVVNEMLLFALTDTRTSDSRARHIIRFVDERGILDFTDEQKLLYIDLHNSDKLVRKHNIMFRQQPGLQQTATMRMLTMQTKE